MLVARWYEVIGYGVARRTSGQEFKVRQTSPSPNPDSRDHIFYHFLVSVALMTFIGGRYTGCRKDVDCTIALHTAPSQRLTGAYRHWVPSHQTYSRPHITLSQCRTKQTYPIRLLPAIVRQCWSGKSPSFKIHTTCLSSPLILPSIGSDLTPPLPDKFMSTHITRPICAMSHPFLCDYRLCSQPLPYLCPKCFLGYVPVFHATVLSFHFLSP